MEQQGEADGTQVVGWNLAAMWQEDKKQAEKLCREQVRGRVYLGVENTGDNVEREAEWCQEVLGKVLNTAARKMIICPPLKR